MEMELFLKDDLLYIKTKYIYRISLSSLITIRKYYVLKEKL